MTTFSIVEDASVGSSGVSAGVIDMVKDGILAAAEWWDRYFSGGSFDIKIELIFDDITGSALAKGGTGLYYSGFDGPGQEIWKLQSMEEYILGAEFAGGGEDFDISVTIDTPTLLGGDFFFDPDPFARTASIPGDESDFISVLLHELAHGFGFLGSIGGEEPGDVEEDGPDITPFDDNVDYITGDRYWSGPSAVAIAGSIFLLDPGSLSHIADTGDGGFESLMNPSLTDGTRAYIDPLLVAMFEDMGMPVRAPSESADVLYGYDMYDDSIDLLGGADLFYGLSGADTVSGGGGNDTLLGEADNDSLEGWAGRDSLNGGKGDDTLFGYGSHDTLGGGVDNDDLRGGYGKDLLNGSGGNDILRGFEGDDRLFGGGGSDTLLGNDDNDSLTGGGGVDRLKGDDGDDTLNGRFGDDSVTGGAGDDLFEFRSGHDADIYDDFTAGAGTDDVIELIAFGAAFDTFAEVIAAASDNGTHTTIDFGGGDTITLLNVVVADLHEDDFVFS